MLNAKKRVIGAATPRKCTTRIENGTVHRTNLAYYRGKKPLRLKNVCELGQVSCARRPDDFDGDTHDSLAFQASSLGRVLAASPLSTGFWIAADDAYASSGGIWTPFSGRQLSSERDAFNFYSTSNRIAIEQTFGQLVARWGMQKLCSFHNAITKRGTVK